MSIKLEVWGDYALFTRPEMKIERVSYDVMTPSAARGILEAIFWHPGLVYRIDRIHVCAPIRFAGQSWTRGRESCISLPRMISNREPPCSCETSTTSLKPTLI